MTDPGPFEVICPFEAKTGKALRARRPTVFSTSKARHEPAGSARGNVRPSRHSGPMRVARTNSEGWKRPGEIKQERVPLCPVCGSQGLELRKNAGTNYLCISCNHTWGA